MFLQDRSSESGKKMLHWSLLSLLACLSGVSSVTVHGYKGGRVSLPLMSIGENLSYHLTCGSKVAYGGQQNERFKGRVIESGHGLIIRDLKTTDAGKWTLSIYGHGHGDPIFNSYEIHVSDNLTGRIGKELVFDDLPHDAYIVVRCNGTVCREMWFRGQGVLNDRLNDNNGRLSIRKFRASDAGIYRVLNSTGEALVTVNVTGCAPQQKMCVRCALSCDDADVHELKKHQSVHVYVERLSETLHHGIYSVSSLYTGGGRCSVVVPDCSKWDRPITLRIYADDEPVSDDILYINWDVKPDPPVSTDCDPDAVSDRDKMNVADRNLSNTLLLLLTLLLLHLHLLLRD